MKDEVLTMKFKNTVESEMDSAGYDPVRTVIVGQDTDTGAIRGYAIGRSRFDGSYAVWSMFDWSRSVDAGRRPNIDLTWGHYRMSYDEAEEFVHQNVEDLLTDYVWYDINTGQRIGGYPRRRR